MLTREVGSTGIRCSAIGLGTWAIGGAMWGGSDDEASVAAIRESLDSGITLIDTAPGYGLGHAEELVGKAIAGRRDDVIIATKCGLNWHSGKGSYFFDQYGKKVNRYLGADGLTYEVEQSLKRLGTDHIDVYITHWQDPKTPIHETMEALQRLKQAGKIRAIGGSNLGADELAQYLDTGGLDCIQERYSIVDRALEAALLPLTKGKPVSTLSYSPLGMGLLTGKIGPDRVFTGDDIRREDPRFSVKNRRAVADFANALTPILREHDITLSQLVIGWTLQQSQIDFVLCGARNQAHARENAKAGRLALTAEQCSAVDAAAALHLAACFPDAVPVQP